ncbi:DUF1622 domain-containing protein [Amaricoccus sp.]|uniref:DUF1622 domain-containing protein n=1 Tax=Amaricoccus sp. TaxID=1872485 RepID=UPI001B44876D|nr:DUF1622 domain-containing protein [Amaricoccus sp.]MBP7000994.1 DUF1622 domain-containing protein [Amaricoccus sp.]
MEGATTAAVPSIAGEFAPLAAALETVATGIELFAIVVLLNGLLRFVVSYVAAEVASRDPKASAARLNRGRVDLSRYILAGLEVFIVSDIVRTVISPTLEALGVLAALVAIRSAISFFLGREIREMRELDGDAP